MTFNLAQTLTPNAELVLSDSYEVRTPASPASQTLKVSEHLQISHLHVNSRSKTCLSVPASTEFLRKSSPAKTCCLCMNSSWRGCVWGGVVRRGLAEGWCLHRLPAGHLPPWVWEPSVAAGTSHTKVLRHCLPRSSYNPASAVPITARTSSVRADKPTQATAGSTLTTRAKVLVSPFLGKVGKVPAKQTLKF